MSKPGNPYRIPKPKQRVLWKGKFYLATAKGKFSGTGLDKWYAVLTADYLWLSSEIAIPLQTVRYIELLNKEGAISIVYYNTLSGQEEVVLLCMLNFLGFHDRKKVRQFNATIQEAIGALPSDSRPGTDLIQVLPDELDIQAGCEKCGSQEAALVELGIFYCFGIYPIAGAYWWKPSRRYLCRDHALRKCTMYNLATSLCGYLGFPGIFVAPIRVWMNISTVKRSFPLSVGIICGEVLTGILLPIIAIGYLLYELW